MEDRGSSAGSRERAVAVLLGLLGVLTLATGFYFVVVRPPMLPQDLRFIGISREQIPARMPDWLGIVFRTWGGFVVGLGIVFMGLAAFLLTSRKALLRWATAAALVVVFGGFLVSNIMLRSDYLAFIAILFGLSVIVSRGLIIWWRESRD